MPSDMDNNSSHSSFGQLDQHTLTVLKKILTFGIDGVGALSSAKSLGDQYLNNSTYSDNFDRIEALIKWEERKNFLTGFLTSIGGIITLPVTIPSSLAANWILQTRMIAAMAHIGGFDIDDPPVRLSIALCLLGKHGKEALNSEIEDFQEMLRKDGISKASKQTIQMLNQVIASKLMRLAAQNGLVRLGKAIPLIGGVLGGAIDYFSCKGTAQFAIELFQLDKSSGFSEDQ